MVEKDEDGFIRVKYNAKSRRRPRTRSTASTSEEISTVQGVNYTKEVALRKTENAVKLLSESSYYSAFLKSLENLVETNLGHEVASIKSIVCYGLGSLCKTSKSIEQFAFLVNLQQSLQVSLELYDPVFTECDVDIISGVYNFKVLDVNEEGRRQVSALSLFFLPHCPHALSNNLLQANWKPELLSNCIIVSNGFTKVLENRLNPELASYEYLSKSKSVTVEIPVRNIFEPIDVFNDLSIHVFPNKLCTSNDLAQTFWNVCDSTSTESNDNIADELIRKCRITEK